MSFQDLVWCWFLVFFRFNVILIQGIFMNYMQISTVWQYRTEVAYKDVLYTHCLQELLCTELGKESQAFSCVEERNSACLSSSSRDDRTLVDLCLESACFSVLCMGMSVPLRVVHSSTGLLSKRCPGIGLLRADREIGVFPHVASPTRLRLRFGFVPEVWVALWLIFVPRWYLTLSSFAVARLFCHLVEA